MRAFRRFLRERRGAAIVEFALVVPIFFTLVFGIIQFSRAYARLNALNSGLREGARKGSTLAAAAQHRDSVTTRVYQFSSAFGFPIDTAQVAVTFGYDVVVGVTSYQLFAGVNFLGTLQNIQVTRSAIFRWEYAP